MKDLKLTVSPNSYWDSDGAYQKEYDELYEKNVPAEGTAKTFNGELIRSISRLFYEFCNNGNCNACDVSYETESYSCSCCGGKGTIEVYGGDDDEELEIEDCEECGGSGDVEEEVEGSCEVSHFYSSFLELIDLIEDKDIRRCTKAVRELICQNLYSSPNQFTPERMNKYNELCDRVIFYVLNNEDKEQVEYQLLVRFSKKPTEESTKNYSPAMGLDWYMKNWTDYTKVLERKIEKLDEKIKALRN